MPWNKGFTKETHPSVKKTSETFKRKKINNFKNWADKMRAAGKIKSNYLDFKKDKYLAELIGVVLGDGHIGKFPRTERLVISCNSKNKGFISRYGGIIEKIFFKKPTYMKVKNLNCVKISVYEKFISKRLGIPAGNRAKLNFKLPKWITKNEEFLIPFLRGLYEAEGSFCVHLPTSTYKIFFANKNTSLLNIVYISLKKLGFKANKSGYKVQISRKKEVYDFKNLINFRNYNNL